MTTIEIDKATSKKTASVAKKLSNHVINLRKELELAKRGSVVVGLLGDDLGPDAPYRSALEVGVIHEFGLGRCPERSFIRLPFKVKRDEMSKAIDNGFKAVSSGTTQTERALGLIGARANNYVIDAFETEGWGKWKPLHPYTIKMKGSSAILIDTGTLRRSVTWEVRGV
jgi:hypothetical protein